LDAEIAAVAATTQRVAVGGLWLQVVGWFLVLLGIVVGGVANVVQAVTSLRLIRATVAYVDGSGRFTYCGMNANAE
jgi:hypothetical protein